MLHLGTATAIAALILGLYLARKAARRESTPLALGLTHGGLGLATVAALAAAAFAGTTAKLVNASLLLFALALVGGLFVLVFRLQGEAPPLFMVMLHGASAMVAGILLAVAILGA